MIVTEKFDKYAIIETGGKQYQAIPGKTIAIEKLDAEAGQEVIFDKVVFKKDAEGSFTSGKPYLDTPVKASVVKHTKDKKLLVFKFKRRKKVRVKKGHRQPITVVRIESF